jgi:aminoglycoside/choline kinase family phosphotransferase
MQTTRHAAPGDARREALIAWARAVLDQRGERLVGVDEMASAASFRRFLRVRTERGSWVAMDSPPAQENNAQFERLTVHFRHAGIPVPALIAHERPQGFLLVTDLGQIHLGDVYGSAAEPIAIERALQILIKIQSLPAAPDLIPSYTEQRLQDEFELCPTWLVEGQLHRTVTPADRTMLDDTCGLLLSRITAQPRCCVHRDYHCRNLLWRDPELGIVDFQDALWGPMLYDVASLLRDCYHRFRETDVEHWRDRYLELATTAGLPIARSTALARDMDWTAVQRQIKAIGIFARLALRDGRNTHLRDIVPVLEALIAVTARYVDLMPLSRWLTGTVHPAAMRKFAAERL